jgi:23S rRNA pseudouridine955/2504/2580 synthase/23S rRNA pseudouridine1911/1915/1917 synthase
LKKYNPEIVFENDLFVAVNKPAGLLSIPDREQTQISLKDILLEKYGSIYTVHRLDKDTSGIIIFAKTEAAHKYFSQLFEGREIEKYYMGLVHGIPTPKKASIDAPIAEHGVQKGFYIVHQRGKPSVTDYEVIEENKTFSLVQFQLHTGRTHQIRVHCKNIGHPLACDELYGDGKPVLLSSIKKKYKLSKHDDAERPMLNRLALHSYCLKFTDVDGKAIVLQAALPKDIRALLQQLKKNN